MGAEEKDLNASNGALVHSIKYFAVWTGCRRIGCEQCTNVVRRRRRELPQRVALWETRRRSLVAAPRSFVGAFVPLNKSRLGN